LESRTAIFSKLVRDFMRGMPPVVSPGTDIGEAVRRMTEADSSSATVVDDAGRPVGILTEQDVARRAAFKLDKAMPVEIAMTTPVHFIAEDEYLYYAIARMRRRNLRHMPVVDSEDVLTGMLNLSDALAHTSATLMQEIDVLTREDDIAGLKSIKAAQVAIAEDLLRESVPATEIQALLTHVNNDIYRRVVELNLKAMADEGLGPPPVKFTVIVMGSGGRGENFLFPDQDNGFILEDYPDDRHLEIDGWFIDLAERMTRDLDVVGLPLCKGYVMATNPLWRKRISEWQEQIRLWSKKRNVTTIRLCDIFFDFRAVYGDDGMAETLRATVTQITQNNPSFLREMHADDTEHGVALGLFGRFITEKHNKAHKGEMNLKHTGTLPLIEAMRLLALREGIEDASTLDRMATLREKGVLGGDEADYLEGTYRHLSFLLLRQQIADFKAGRMVSNYVHPRSLTHRERDILVVGFKAIRTLRGKVRSEFTGEVF